MKESSPKSGLCKPQAWVAVALRATTESKDAVPGHRRTQRDGHQKAISHRSLKRLGIVLACLALTACDHHKKPQTSDSSAPVASGDSTYTGVKYPRATPVALPVQAPVASTANPSSPPPLTETPPPPTPAPAPINESPEPATTVAASAPPEAAAPSPVPMVDTTAPSIIPPPPVTPPPRAPMTETEAKKQVVVLETNLGRIVIELNDVAAPRTCGNFRKLVSDGFYDHTIFHRVIPHFMIQGGDPNTKSDDRVTYGQGDPGYTLPAEIGQKHTAGAVAMARLPDALNKQRDSNGSQFFICVSSCPSLDDQYTVFGHVIEGLDVANQIANQPRDQRDNPNDRIEIKAHLETKRRALGSDLSTP